MSGRVPLLRSRAVPVEAVDCRHHLAGLWVCVEPSGPAGAL